MRSHVVFLTNILNGIYEEWWYAQYDEHKYEAVIET